MKCDSLKLLNSVITDAYTIQKLTYQAGILAENACVGVIQRAAETIHIWVENGGLKTEQKHNSVRNYVCEIAQSLDICYKLDFSPE